MIHLLPYALLLVNHLALSLTGIASIFFLMRAYSLWCSPNRKLTRASLSYLFFVPELVTGPHRDFHDWKPMRFKWRLLNLDLCIKIVALICLILLSGIAVSAVADATQNRIYRGFAIYLCLFAQFYSISKIVNEISIIFGQTPILNFNNPFAATSVANFWERWHMSLGNFAKRYIAGPLNFDLRKKKIGIKTAYGLTTFATFFFIGLWHNLSIEYLLFGLYFSTIITAEKLIFASAIDTLKAKKYGPYALMLYAQIGHFLGFLIVAEKVFSILIKA